MKKIICPRCKQGFSSLNQALINLDTKRFECPWCRVYLVIKEVSHE